MKTFWRIVNITNLILIIVVLIWAEDISGYMGETRQMYNDAESLTDFEVLTRTLLNKWEGISLAFNLLFVFFFRGILSIVSGATKKITS